MKAKPEMSKHGQEIERALQEAVADAVEEHRRAGRPIVIQKNGKPVLVDAHKVKTVREHRAEYRQATTICQNTGREDTP